MKTRRSFLTGTAAALAGFAVGDVAAASEPGAGTCEFVGGYWFDGRRFKAAHYYGVDGVLTARRPRRIDAVIDLTGKYVVPPFGEAHNHNVEAGPGLSAILQRYLHDGIFYVKNPTNPKGTKAALLGKVNTATSVDAVFSNGGLTASGGHPIGVAERNLKRGGKADVWADGDFYFVIDSEADLEAKWGAVLAGQPDFVKTTLQYSEEYQHRKNDPSYFDWKGLDPALLPHIVRRAHAANLRVSTHVETAADFHHALVAGADEINHMPGFRPDRGNWSAYAPASFRISEADARLAAKQGTVVVTTLVFAIDRITEPREGDHPDEVHGVLIDNLRLLSKHGVSIAIGSDSYRQTSLVEILSLQKLKVFDNRTLLKMWCEATPATIFPSRRIGRLREGYEASLLALDGNPLEDWLSVTKIVTRVKQGTILTA
jgi:predicted amidohydrolase YtcJ